MSVYSYVVLKVHTNVWKAGTHLNMCFIYRTYVRWKYTYLFAYKKYCSLYLYIMNISLSRPFLFLISIILYLYKGNTLSRTLPLAPHLSYLFLCLPLYYFIIYSIYREEHTFPQLLPLSHTSIILLLYIDKGTLFPPLFLPSYKVNTFTPPTFLTLIVWEKVCGEKFLKTLLV